MHIPNLYDYSFLQKLFVFTVNIAIADQIVLVHVGPNFFTLSNIGH